MSYFRNSRGGEEAARAVSEKAQRVLDSGGASSDEGRRLLLELDDELQAGGGELNPGTSADLTASSLFVNLLGGWRP